MSFPVPERVQYEIIRFIKIPETDRKKFKETLKKAPFALHPGALADYIQTLLRKDNIKIPNIKRLIGTFTSLFSLRESLKVTTKILVNDIFETIFSTAKVENLNTKDLEKVKNEIIQILGYKNPLAITSKANEVLTQHQHIYSSARILTDIRPIFEENDRPVPRAALIIHTLKIVYATGGDFHEFFVALDSKDIEELGKLISRAKNKESTLIGTVKKSGLKYINIP